MELIVIDEERMKIMLSREELLSYNIYAPDIDTEDESTKRILYDIIDRAKRTAGFDGEWGSMFVRVFPSGDGGCEMYVTKYAQLYDEDEYMCDDTTEDKGHGARARARRYVYRLASADLLLRCCRALADRGYAAPSDVYISEDGETYFLVLHEGECDTSVALEFGESVSFSGVLVYLSEHARILVEKDGVGSMSVIF